MSFLDKAKEMAAEAAHAVADKAGDVAHAVVEKAGDAPTLLLIKQAI